MGRISSRRLALVGCACIAALGVYAPAHAQAEPEAQKASSTDGALEEIIVTARRRDEKLQDVPVVISAFNRQQLEAFAAGGFEDIAALTPGLIIDEGGGAGQGSISLRGVTTGVLNTSSDQAISINIDGVQLSNADALRFGQFDMEQLEVLKGPQALFFGKNSPGGILTVRTSDPTRQVFSAVSGSYESSSHEKVGQATLSGPITTTLAGRLFLRLSDEDGQVRNAAPGVADKRGQRLRDQFARLTLTWRPTDALDTRFKLSYGNSKGGNQNIEQRFGCAATGAVSGPVDDCQFNKTVVKADPDPRLATVHPTFTATPSGRVRPLLTSLEANYRLSENLKLSSITGYSDIRVQNYGNLLPVVAPLFVGGSDQTTRSLSEEVRLTSQFSGPLNFMVGAFIDDRLFKTDSALLVPAPPFLPAGSRLLFANVQQIDSTAKSAFGQMTWGVSETVELSGGARYTEETRELSGVGSLSPFGFGVLFPGSFTRPVDPTGAFKASPSKISYSDLSPEATIRWRPSSSFMAFAAYKQGFMSGGFNTSVSGNATQATRPSDQTYRPETVEGYEVGIKSTPMPGLRLNLSVFNYVYDDIQLSTFDFSSTSITTRVVNASRARTQGFEVETVWAPQTVSGLTFTGNLAYNDAAYISDYFDKCNGMQLAGKLSGCDYLPTTNGAVRVANGTGSAQNLNGFTMGRAPKWTGSAGFNYDRKINPQIRLTLNGIASYSSSYHANQLYDPRALQSAFWIYNASVGLHAVNNRWSLALVGRNLTDELFKTGVGGNLPLGGPAPGELQGPISRPRSVMLELTVRPSAF
jgi:iron complex outermembrane receptor protein